MMNEIIKNTKEKVKQVNFGHYKLTTVKISECAFADDLVVFGSTEKELQENLNIWKHSKDKNNGNNKRREKCRY
jgi:hypothetical protein